MIWVFTNTEDLRVCRKPGDHLVQIQVTNSLYHIPANWLPDFSWWLVGNVWVGKCSLSLPKVVPSHSRFRSKLPASTQLCGCLVEEKLTQNLNLVLTSRGQCCAFRELSHAQVSGVAVVTILEGWSLSGSGKSRLSYSLLSCLLPLTSLENFIRRSVPSAQ